MSSDELVEGLRKKFHSPKDHLAALVEFFLIVSESGDKKEKARGLALYVAQVSRNLAVHNWDVQKLIDDLCNQYDTEDGWLMKDMRTAVNAKGEEINYPQHINLEYISAPRVDISCKKNDKLNKFLEFHYAYGLHIHKDALSDYANYEDHPIIDQAIGLLSVNNWDVQKAILLYKTNNRQMCDISAEVTVVWRDEAQAYVTSTLTWDDNCYDPLSL